MEVWSATRQSPEDRPLTAIYVRAFSADQPLAGVRRIERKVSVGIAGISTSGDEINRQVRVTKLCQAAGNARIALVGERVSGSNIQWQREGVIADIRRVVAGGASA